MESIAKRLLTTFAVSTVLVVPSLTYATNGYFKIGYGTKSRGMGGIAIGTPVDSLAPAANPAGLAFIGNRVDAGLEIFNPNREASFNATLLGGSNTGEIKSGANTFGVPNAGMAMQMGNMSGGIAIFANGGMNSRYNTNVYAAGLGAAIPGFVTMVGTQLGSPVATQTAVTNSLATIPFGGSTLGVNLAQLIIAPSFAYKFSKDHALGASVLLGYQQFRAHGLGLFTGFSSDSTNLTNKGNDNSFGAGVRLGWMSKFDTVTVGVSASSKIYMEKFDDYAGLFAEQGAFDIPANFGFGISFTPNKDFTIGLDVMRIMYGDVKAISNDGPTGAQFAGTFVTNITNALQAQALNTGVTNQLGSDAGYGFGWDDMTIYKLGGSYAVSNKWQLNAGFNYGESPIDNNQNFFNILAPGVVEKHITLGFTYSPTRYKEISFTYMRALQKDQTFTFDTSSVLAGSSYDVEIGMDQNAVELSYAMKF